MLRTARQSAYIPVEISRCVFGHLMTIIPTKTSPPAMGAAVLPSGGRRQNQNRDAEAARGAPLLHSPAHSPALIKPYGLSGSTQGNPCKGVLLFFHAMSVRKLTLWIDF